MTATEPTPRSGRGVWTLLWLLLVHVFLGGLVVLAAEVMALDEICPDAAHASRVWNDAVSVVVAAWLLSALVVVFWWSTQRRLAVLFSVGWMLVSLVLLYTVVHIEAQPFRCGTF